MATLYFLHPGLDDHEFWFDPKTVDIIIGSDSSCQVTVPHESIAPLHARIVSHEGNLWIQDLSSSDYGMYAHGAKLSSVLLEINSSHHFRVGKVELILFLEENDDSIIQAPKKSLREDLLIGGGQYSTITQERFEDSISKKMQSFKPIKTEAERAAFIKKLSVKKAQKRKRKNIISIIGLILMGGIVLLLALAFINKGINKKNYIDRIEAEKIINEKFKLN